MTTSTTPTALPPVVDSADATVDHGITITARPAFAPEHSEPAENRYVFTYDIAVANAGPTPAQVMARHWLIIDADGHREDVRGPGVIGKQPRLAPGQSFTYQSFCPLPTRWGTMEGTYHMRRDDGTEFDVSIPRFVLHAD